MDLCEIQIALSRILTLIADSISNNYNCYIWEPPLYELLFLIYAIYSLLYGFK